MAILNEATLLKISLLPADRRQQVIDGLAKLLAERAHSHIDERARLLQPTNRDER